MDSIINKKVKLFMIFDILGDTVRSGPIQWCVDRFRIEDVKNHIFDLLLIYRLIKDELPIKLDDNKMFDYIICHDLPEAITGDITAFEGVSEEEKKYVTKIAIDYLSKKFNDIMDFNTIINNYEEKIDIETKIVKMIDKIHSAIAFIKYETERHIDYNNPNIITSLRYNKVVDEGINNGLDVADIFYEYHIKALNFSQEELIKYKISRDNANEIIRIIKSFIDEMYEQKKNKTLINVDEDFPEEAKKYKKCKNDKNIL